MFLTLYALLLRMLVIDLHAKNQHNICKGIEKKKKKVWKTVSSMKFTKSKAVIPRKLNEVQQNSNSICMS